MAFISLIKVILVLIGLLITIYHLFRAFILQIGESKAMAVKFFLGTIVVYFIITAIDWIIILL